MKITYYLLFLLLFGTGCPLLTGCNPHNISIVLTNDASLKKLNEIVKERIIRVTTKDSIYTGDNIVVNRDSTLVQNIFNKPRVIPYASMKSINYTTDRQPLDGIIELKNGNEIKAQNICISADDSVIRFDEVLTTSAVFPTKELLKIQRRDHLHSTLKGLGYGILGGAAVGAILGTFVGNTGGNEPPGLVAQGSNYEGTPRPVIFIFSTIVCGICGAIIGTVTGAILGQWQDIDITYGYEENSP